MKARSIQLLNVHLKRFLARPLPFTGSSDSCCSRGPLLGHLPADAPTLLLLASQGKPCTKVTNRRHQWTQGHHTSTFHSSTLSRYLRTCSPYYRSRQTKIQRLGGKRDSSMGSRKACGMGVERTEEQISVPPGQTVLPDLRHRRDHGRMRSPAWGATSVSAAEEWGLHRICRVLVKPRMLWLHPALRTIRRNNSLLPLDPLPTRHKQGQILQAYMLLHDRKQLHRPRPLQDHRPS